jgi:hypothetical protein
MPHLIGRGRYAREAYPETSRAGGLTNRYLISPAGPATPDVFTTTGGAPHIVAAVNVVRRASGLFVVMVQMPATLASAALQEWAATMLFGATSSGGTVNGDWILGIGAPITFTAPSGSSLMGVYFDQDGAGNLTKTVTMIGINAAPVPSASGTIVVGGATVGSDVQITPGLFLASAYELP